MQPTVRILIVLYGALAALSAATDPKAGHARATTTKSDASSPDAAIEKAIREKFAKSKISVDKFEVHVQGGTARIEGRTNVIQHKGTATRLAKTAGAKQVVNKVLISDEARKTAASNLENGRRRAQVKRGDSRDERK